MSREYRVNVFHHNFETCRNKDVSHNCPIIGNVQIMNNKDCPKKWKETKAES